MTLLCILLCVHDNSVSEGRMPERGKRVQMKFVVLAWLCMLFCTRCAGVLGLHVLVDIV